ncbi:MAG: hypothetical protein DBX40_04310 [Clostridiales bacterium]|nr:MAG: hypothetical protein DBX40_04310 [Clostridiales bacterium]
MIRSLQDRACRIQCGSLARPNTGKKAGKAFSPLFVLIFKRFGPAYGLCVSALEIRQASSAYRRTEPLTF